MTSLRNFEKNENLLPNLQQYKFNRQKFSKMTCLNILPVEILQNIVENIQERPFKTEFLLLNKTLCHLLMVEQVRTLKLTTIHQVNHWTVTAKNSMISTLQYCKLLNKIHKLIISIHENHSLQATAEFISHCTKLRNLVLELPKTLSQDMSLIFNRLPFNINEIFINGIHFKNENEIRSLVEYMRRDTKLLKQNFVIEDLKLSSTVTYLKIHLHGSKFGNFVRAVAEGLIHNTVITELNLEKNSINVDGAHALAECLKDNIALTSLNLEENDTGAGGAHALAECLKQNITLTKMNLKSNNIGTEGAHALAEGLKQNKTLTNLNISYNNIGAEGVLALAECIKMNTALTNLSLNDNKIADESARAIAECLKQNTVLTNLELEGNNISAEGAHALAEGLQQNKTLTNLNISYNKISAKGAHALAQCLKQSIALTELNLKSNRIGDEGARALAKCLEQNTSLTNLNLCCNSIRDEGACALAKCLKRNSTLSDLDLCCNNINNARALAECSKPNVLKFHY